MGSLKLLKHVCMCVCVFMETVFVCITASILSKDQREKFQTSYFLIQPWNFDSSTPFFC